MFLSFLRILSISVVALSLTAAAPSVKKEEVIRKTSHPLPADRILDTVRVRVLEKQSEVIVSTASPFEVFDENDRLLFSGQRIVSTLVTASPSSLNLGAQRFPGRKLKIVSFGDIEIGKRIYSEAVEFIRGEDGKMTVLNRLSLEEYLKGVLPKEVSPQWGLAALKAQAIASRTFVIFRMIESQDAPYDVRADVTSQMFGGKGAHHEVTDRAVDETRGLILMQSGEVFSAFFHATCGGKTAPVHIVWNNEPHPSLNGIECRFCQGSKHYRWETVYTTAEIQNHFKKNGIPLSGLHTITPLGTDSSGRVERFLVVDKLAKRRLDSSIFRMYLDPFKFKSTLLNSVTREGKSYRFKGKGWGHGVGLCQHGSRKLAELGYDYRQILAHYYPHSQLSRYPAV